MRTILLPALVLMTAACSAHDFEGTVAIGAHDVDVTREGDLSAGATTRFACKVDGGIQVDGVQAWYGLASDAQRTTCDYDSGDGDYDCDVMITTPIPPGAELFIVVTSNGTAATGSIAIH